MRPTFIPGFTAEDLYAVLLAEAPWVNVDEAPRDECFMALDTSRTYTYGKANRRRTYKAAPMHAVVRALMDRLNAERGDDRLAADKGRGCEYNVCVLNYYRSELQHLGWHADDSPEQDPNHPIAVLAFGAPREIWVRIQGEKGHVPDDDKFLMTPGGLFVMPPGFQETHYHKIPKHDRPCGGRISLTYRKLDR